MNRIGERGVHDDTSAVGTGHLPGAISIHPARSNGTE
jgi:hypothetical protein